MTWSVEFDDRAAKELRKLDRQVQDDILRYLRQRIATDGDSSRFGKPLTGDFLGLWRYRIRDCRLICSLEDDRFVVLVLQVGHRRDVYGRRR